MFGNLLDMQIMIFLLIATGYLLCKLGVIDSEIRKGLTALVVNVVLPCNIIYSFFIEMNLDILKSCFSILAISFGIQITCLFGSNYLYRNHTSSRQKVLKYATICSNAGFIGNPLVEQIYGSQGLLYASIYLIPQRIFMWSAGISCFTPAKGKEVIRKVLTHPCIIAVIIGFLIMVLQLPVPAFAKKTILSFSSCTTALSMLIIGGILAEVDLKTVCSKLTLFYSFIRLIAIPAIVLLLCWVLQLDQLVTSVAVVLSGMPAGTTTAILAAKYSGDEKFAASCVFLSTVLSLLSIPFFCVLIEMVL